MLTWACVSCVTPIVPAQFTYHCYFVVLATAKRPRHGAELPTDMRVTHVCVRGAMQADLARTSGIWHAALPYGNARQWIGTYCHDYAREADMLHTHTFTKKLTPGPQNNANANSRFCIIVKIKETWF